MEQLKTNLSSNNSKFNAIENVIYVKNKKEIEELNKAKSEIYNIIEVNKRRINNNSEKLRQLTENQPKQIP